MKNPVAVIFRRSAGGRGGFRQFDENSEEAAQHLFKNDQLGGSDGVAIRRRKDLCNSIITGRHRGNPFRRRYSTAPPLPATGLPHRLVRRSSGSRMVSSRQITLGDKYYHYHLNPLSLQNSISCEAYRVDRMQQSNRQQHRKTDLQ